MILNFLDKISGFFDRSFVVAYWAPVFLTAGLLAGVQALHAGIDPVVAWWNRQDAGERVMVGLAILLTLTALAYMLQALTSTVVRTFEGYTWPSGLAKWAAAGHRARQRKWKHARDSESSVAEADLMRFRLYFSYPEDPEHVRPTRLGNVLAAAEDYAQEVYGANTVLWWPRLFALLPDGFREQISAALIPMLSLLNLSGGCALVALLGGTYLAVADARWWPLAVVFAGGMLLARLCYESAVAQAAAYGNLIRSAFDLYRRQVLEKMGFFIPATVQDEQILWDILNAWLYHFSPPVWSVKEGGPAWVSDPFRYDGKVPGDAVSPPAERGMPVGFAVHIGWFVDDRSPPGGP